MNPPIRLFATAAEDRHFPTQSRGFAIEANAEPFWRIERTATAARMRDYATLPEVF